MKILSRKFQDNEQIPAKYTCDGENVNPTLVISGVPEEAKSLVLIVDDPDAPMGTWIHWTLWNIASDIMEIKENSIPKGAIQGLTSFGKVGYGGPCPPSGIHHYHFKLYAIDAVLDLPETANKMELEKEINGRILAEAELLGLYSRDR